MINHISIRFQICKMGKIIDAFIFYNELDILELRLKELDSLVDTFILVEATKTFAGNPKECYFENNRNKYQNYLNKIIHIIVSDMPEQGSAWDREAHQRNAIRRGYEKMDIGLDDIVMMSDVDEIPDAETIRKVKDRLENDTVYKLEQRMFYYNYSCVGNMWSRAVLFKGSNLAKMSMQTLRSHQTITVIRPGDGIYHILGCGIH